MTHTDLVLELLDDVFPGAYCDDCLSTELDIQPRQQVNQIGRRLSLEGKTTRQRGFCSLCKKPKTINTFNKPGSSAPDESHKELHESLAVYLETGENPPAPVFNIETARTDVVRICHEIWYQHRQDAPPRSISLVINSLRGDKFLPSHQANMMLTLCSLRNVYVYENLPMGLREIEIGVNALSIIQDWWEGNR